MLLCAIVILGAATGLGLLGWFVATRVVPSMAHPAAVLDGLGGAIVLVAASLLIDRPWLVEAERRGIDAPRRVWRVRGWRQSGRVLREVVAAIRRGRLDVEPAGRSPRTPARPSQDASSASRVSRAVCGNPQGAPPTRTGADGAA